MKLRLFFIILIIIICSALYAETEVERSVSASHISSEFSRDNPPKVGIVLSGGAAHGFAHLAVLRTLEEIGIPIDIITGSSMGALAGGLYSIGYSPADIQQVLEEMNWGEVFLDSKTLLPYLNEPIIQERDNLLSFYFDRNGIGRSLGLFPDQRIMSILSRLTYKVSHIRDYDQFSIPFRAMGTDLFTGEEMVLQHAPIAASLRSTMSIPGFFSPYLYVKQPEVSGAGTADAEPAQKPPLQKRYVLDGGVVNNLPVLLARDMGADIVLAFDVDSRQKEQIDEFSSPVDVLSYYTAHVINLNESIQKKSADYIFEIPLPPTEKMEFWKYQDIIDRGTAAMMEERDVLESIAEEIAQYRPLVKLDPDRRGSYASLNFPVLEHVRIEPGYETSRAFPLNLFSNLIGEAPVPREIDHIINRVASSEVYESIAFTLYQKDGAYGLSLMPVERNRGRHHFGVSFIFDGTFSSTSQEELWQVHPGFSADLVFKELYGTSSYLHVNFELLNNISSFAELYIPLSNFVYLRPYIEGGKWDYPDKEVGSTASETVLSYINAGQEVGISVNSFMRFGFTAKTINSRLSPVQQPLTDDTDGGSDEETAEEEGSGLTQENAIVLMPIFKWTNFESTRFCHQGINFAGSIEFPLTKNDDWYRRFHVQVEHHLPLYSNGTFTYAVSAGSFRGEILTRQNLFTVHGWDGIPGGVSRGAVCDDFFLGGVEFSHRFAGLSEILSMDVYALMQMKAGAGFDEADRLSDIIPVGGAAAGIGLDTALGELVFGAGLNTDLEFSIYLLLNS